jgi:pantothenate synthetase
MSSRNKYLSVESRESAAIIYSALTHGISLLNNGERNSNIIRQEITKKIQGEASAKIDYISISNNTSLEEVRGKVNGSVLISTAVYFDGVRLIDNISYSSD